MGASDEGWLPLLPNSSGRVAIPPPAQNRGQRSRRRIDTTAMRREGEGTFVGEFPPVAAFPVQPENHVGSSSLASSRGFASSMGSSRGFFSRTVAAAKRGADLAACPSGAIRFFGNPTIEEPLVASIEAPLAPVTSDVDEESRGSHTRESLEERHLRSAGRPAPLEIMSPSDRGGDGPDSPQNSPVTPASAKDRSVTFEERLKRKAGCALHTLHLGDLRRSKALRSEMQTMKLHDYFDIRGTPRFRRLGLSFAAKQNAEVKDSFGSCVKAEDDDDGNRRNFSAKSYFCATQAILKDIHYGESMKFQTLKSVEEMERFRAEDVQLRQLEMLFLEVPDFERYMPTDIDYSELIPPAIDKDAEIKERRSSERATSHLADMRWVEGRRMGWMLTREEALLLTDFTVLWTRASRTTNCPFGMDRPTFCRMILDLDLVDQEKVPYYWAISLFDSVAQAVRCCPADATWSNTAPSAFVVNRWALLSIFDTLLRQHYDESSKSKFFDTLKEVAATALPAHLRSSVQELVKKSDKRPSSKASARDRAKTASRESNRPQPAESREGRKVKNASQFQSEPAGGRFKSRVQAAQVHFKMLTNVMVGLNKAGDLEIDDDGTKNIHNLIKAEEEKEVEKRESEPADHNTVPAWLKPPELPAPNLDTKCERLARDRLVTGMLVEPEVLHIVAQYHQPFQEMHRIYADSKGHMSFHELLQFCHDFRLTPQLVSSDLLRGAYSSVQNLEIVELPPQVGAPKNKTRFSFPDESVEAEEPESPRSPISPRSNGSRSERSRDRKSLQNRDKPTPAENFKSAVKRSSTSNSLKSDIDEPAAEKQKQFDNDKSTKARLTKSLTSMPGRRSSLPGVVRKLQEARMDRRRSSDSETQEKALDDYQGRGPSVAVLFGVSAFVEVLCRVAFIRLGSYGNFVQQSSPAYARIVWLITYLRYMFSSLREKNEQYTASQTDLLGEDVADNAKPVPRLLLKALQTLPPDWGKPAARVSEDIPLGEAVVHPKPGIGCKKKRRKARQNLQANQPRLAPSMHTSPAIRMKMHNLALAAQRNLAARKSKTDNPQKSVQPSPQAPLSRTARRVSTILTPAAIEKAVGSRTNSKEQAPGQGPSILKEQNNSKESAADTKDGSQAPRPQPSKGSSDQSGSRPDSVGSDLDASSSDESLQEDEPVLTGTKKEVETPVAKGRRISNSKTTHGDLQSQTRALLERSAGKECWSLDELFEAEAGKSCVLNGYCSICERSVRARQWGNPRCRGCSIVDYLPFEHHLFKLVLTERSKWNVTYKALVTDLPPGVDKYELTPPPVGDLDVILQKYFGHNKDSIEAMK